MKIIGLSLRPHKKNCSQNSTSIFSFTNWIIIFAKTFENNMVVGLLIYTQEQGIYRLDEEISPHHFGHLHTNKLHKWTTTSRCGFTTTTKACIQSWI
jgi:hypothetical protein